MRQNRSKVFPMPTPAAFAKLHKEFPTRNHPQMVMELRKSGELQRYLTEQGEQAMAMYESLAEQMEHRPDLPTEYWARVAELEQIPLVVAEMVLHDLIYQPPK